MTGNNGASGNTPMPLDESWVLALLGSRTLLGKLTERATDLSFVKELAPVYQIEVRPQPQQSIDPVSKQPVMVVTRPRFIMGVCEMDGWRISRAARRGNCPEARGRTVDRAWRPSSRSSWPTTRRPARRTSASRRSTSRRLRWRARRTSAAGRARIDVVKIYVGWFLSTALLFWVHDRGLVVDGPQLPSSSGDQSKWVQAMTQYDYDVVVWDTVGGAYNPDSMRKASGGSEKEVVQLAEGLAKKGCESSA